MYLTSLTRKIEIGANCYLLEFCGKRLVLDAGMHPRSWGEECLPDFGVLGEEAPDAIIITHAHQDHIGSLAILIRKFPDTPVFMSPGTRAIADITLHNSVNVMVKQRDELGLSSYPLFTHREVDRGIRSWMERPTGFKFGLDGERMSPSDTGFSLEFFDAGHVLGAVGVKIRCGERSVFYTGDVNFEDQTVTAAAAFPEDPVDLLIMETTRGNSPTPAGFTRAAEEDRLAAALHEAFERGGSVLMPLFALGKTQELLSMIHVFRESGRIANVPIYIGGLSAKLTELYDRLSKRGSRLLPGFKIMKTVEPFVIAGRHAGIPQIKPERIYAFSSGMMTEKTISNSYAQSMLGDPQQTILFVGYADPDSPAGKLLAAKPGDMLQLDPSAPAQPLRCKVERFQFSSHASRESLIRYSQKLAPKNLVLVHGDPPAVQWFQETLKADLPSTRIEIPEPGKRISFDQK